jgi:hypothetical protein
MVTILSDYATTAAAEDVLTGFNVERDRMRVPSQEKMPLVNIWLDSITPVPDGSSGKLQCQEIAKINIDCYARGIDTTESGKNDYKAMARLYFLKEQVRYALFSLINHDFGHSVGKIARKHWPEWQLFQNDLKLPETEVVAGRWALEIEYFWQPEDISGTDFDSIHVFTETWAALYDNF